jgi:SAM-dependent methyltransferase
MSSMATELEALPGGPLAGAAAALRGRLVCPSCRRPVAEEAGGLACRACGLHFAVQGRVIDLRPPTAAGKAEVQDWTDHWAADRQDNVSQRFFSWYRKAVFARTVSYFIERFFPPGGVFLEAGSGTSETSQRIDKRGGARTLVACDIVPPVLARCHPVMDVALGADIFRMPFADASVDGVWNVGVMEHFTAEQIDAILGELHRVLRPGAPLLLLWPARDSVPQKLLRLVEVGINLRRREGPRFRFHPDEISQLRSSAEGRSILGRNGFEVIHIDPGPRSLMAFKTIVARRSSAGPAAGGSPAPSRP